MSIRTRAIIISGVALGAALAAQATPIEFTGSSGALAGSAWFEVSGTTLKVTLTNTSKSDVTLPSQVLTALFFESNVPLALTRASAVVPAGSAVIFGGTDPGGVVGGEWAYKSGIIGAPNGLSYGISSAGLGLFGPGDRFPGNNLQGPTNPNGLQYGITSAADNTSTGNSPVTGDYALIKNHVSFTLYGLPVNFDPSRNITKVFFQYGTDLSDGGFILVPEPATVLFLLVGGLMALPRFMRK